MMDKVFKALEHIKTHIIIESEIKVNKELGVVNPYYNDHEIIKEALTELKAIKESNPSEALECLERIDNTLCLNNIKGKLEFGIDTEEHNDCDSVIGMTEDLETIKNHILKTQEIGEENEILREIIKSFFDRGCPLHQYIDKDFGLAIEVDDECSTMILGEYKGVDLDKYLKEVLNENVK